MKRNLTSLLFIFSTLSFSSVAAQTPSFPGAEGHGRYVAGGRGGKIVHVTNLNDSGAGSFRQAVSGSDKKIVVFDVGGVIAMKSDINIGANTTIMGQTAPAPGITLRYYTLQPNGNNIVIRFIRSRRGQERNVNDGADAIWTREKTGLMLDHCSFSWSIDEVASFYDNNNFTMQWCTIGESLVHSGHKKGPHGYGGIWGGKLASFHHNLILHVANRSPRFNGARYNWKGYTTNSLYSQYQWKNALQAENVDFRNCVVYNTNGCYDGPGGGQINMVANYYKSGPGHNIDRLTTVSLAGSGNAGNDQTFWDMTSRYYLDGNIIDGNSAGWERMRYDGGVPQSGGSYYTHDPNHYYGDDVTYTKVGGVDCVPIRLDSEAPTGNVTTHSADVAFDRVLTYAGASLHQDDVDERYMSETRNGTCTYKGSATSYVQTENGVDVTKSCTPEWGRIDLVSDVNGYTEANFGTGSRPAGFDTDNDGIPDTWETANGLNPNDAGDATKYTIDPAKYYTNIEVYCNSLVQPIMLNGNSDAVEAVVDYFPAYHRENGELVAAVNPDVAVGDDPGMQPADGIIATGTVTWPMSTAANQEGEVSEQLGKYITAGNYTYGSNLTKGGVRSNVMTEFKVTTKESGIAASNAITFPLTIDADYLFQPTKVAFYTERRGTDSGAECVSWVAESTTVIESGIFPDRDTYTDYEATLSGVMPSGGAGSLVINVYNLNAGKSMAVGHVVVTGNVVSNASAVTSVTAEPAAVEYHNLQGMRLDGQPKVFCIETVYYTDGSRKSRVINIAP